MNRNARGFRPLADSLEPRLMLSDAAAPRAWRLAPIATAPPFAPGRQPVNTLVGEYSGVGNLRLLDVPLDVTIRGKGWVKGMGHTWLYGSVALGGYRPIGEIRVTLSNPRGTITARMSDAEVTEPVPASTFKVTAVAGSGTGAYKDVHSVETATVSFGPDTVHDESTSFLKAIGGVVTVRLDVAPPKGEGATASQAGPAEPPKNPAAVGSVRPTTPGGLRAHGLPVVVRPERHGMRPLAAGAEPSG